MKKLTIFLAVALVSVAPTQIAKSGVGYLFRIKHTKGAVVNYSVVSTIGTFKGKDGKPMKMTLPMVWKVASVQNGVATVDTLVGPVSLGKETMMQPTKNRMQINARGQVTGSGGVGQQVMPVLPEKPLKVGQSWSASAPVELPMGGGQQKIGATYTFKGLKLVGGRQVAELAVKMTGQATGQGSMLLSTNDGLLYSSNLKMTLIMPNQSGANTNYPVTVDIKRK